MTFFFFVDNDVPEVIRLKTKSNSVDTDQIASPKRVMDGAVSVPRCPTNLDYGRAKAYTPCSRCGGVVWTFFLLSIISFFFFPL